MPTPKKPVQKTAARQLRSTSVSLNPCTCSCRVLRWSGWQRLALTDSPSLSPFLSLPLDSLSFQIHTLSPPLSLSLKNSFGREIRGRAAIGFFAGIRTNRTPVSSPRRKRAFGNYLGSSLEVGTYFWAIPSLPTNPFFRNPINSSGAGRPSTPMVANTLSSGVISA